MMKKGKSGPGWRYLDDARDEMIRMEELEQARKAVNGDKVVPINQMAFKAV